MSSIISDIGHAVEAPFKAIANVSEDIFSGVKKVFKSITGSAFGRALLIGATIYLGGAAFGMWDSPFASINGAFTSQAAASSGTVGATEAAAGNAAQMGQAAQDTLGVAGGAGGGSTVSAADATANALNTANAAGTSSLGTIPAAPDLAASAPAYEGGVVPGAGGVSPTLTGAAPAASKGFIDSIIHAPSGLPQYALIQTGAGALQSAFAPNAADLAKQQAELQRQNFQWQQQFLEPNFNVASLNLGVTPSGKPLTTTSGQPVYPAGTPTPPAGFITAAARQPLPQTVPIRT